MKIAALILSFLLIIFAALLISSGSKIDALQPYHDYFWTPIPLGILLFVYTFMQKVPDKGKGK